MTTTDTARETFERDAERHYHYWALDLTMELRKLDSDDEDTADEARESLTNDSVLSVQAQIHNYRTETYEWEILLGTGGPAMRVYVTTDEDGTVKRAEYQFQDRGTEWFAPRGQDAALVEQFASLFYLVKYGCRIRPARRD
jgi:hypothetical protein